MALRDLLLISLAGLGLLWVGAVTTGAATAWLAGRFRGWVDEILLGLVLFSAGLALFGFRQWRQARHEAAARDRTERRFRALVENMPAVTYTWDPREPAGAVPPTYVSPQVEPILGFSVQEWRADPTLWIRRIHPDDRDRVVEASNRADRLGEPFSIEYRHLKPDGTTIWVREEAIVVERDAAGRPTLVQGLMVDVTDRKRAEEQVARAEARYRSLVEHLPLVIYVNDLRAEPEERYVSPGVERLLGYSQEEWLSDPERWHRVVHPEDREWVLRDYRRAVAAGQPWSAEYRMVARDGSVVWVHDDARIVEVGPSPERSVWQGACVDVTARK